MVSGWVLTFAVVLGLSWVGTGAALKILARRAVLDHPNERSSHSRPTPRGGGVAVVASILAAWAATGGGDDTTTLVILIALGLGALSFVDDLRGLPPLPRFGTQLISVGAVLAALPDGALVFQGLLPLGLDRLAAALVWLWFINLYNFMDGIDGITGVETVCVAGGLAGIMALVGQGGEALVPHALAPHALAMAAAALGFLAWNWHPARIFMGDVGSVPLGFLLGWLLVQAAVAGLWVPALILPAYYLADASITLLRRLLRGEKVWQAHREHFYQKAVRAGWSHATVSSLILAANLGLVGLAGAAAVGAAGPVPALAGAAATVAALLAALTWGPRLGAGRAA
ncbi:MAG: glycosyltransferase family 4 protein [Alphaproteobacteria bacterium]